MEVNYHQFPNGKRYVYICRNGSGPIFLRNVIFLVRARSGKEPEIAIVREWGAKRNAHTWEPPKGQMEWGEFDNQVRRGSKLTEEQLYPYMRAGILRELSEEAKIKQSEISNLTLFPQAYTQKWTVKGLPNAHFQYQFWIAQADDKTMFEAQKRIQTLVDHTDMPHIVPHDVCEKDAVMWWKPDDGWSLIRDGFSQKLTRAFFHTIKRHGQ